MTLRLRATRWTDGQGIRNSKHIDQSSDRRMTFSFYLPMIAGMTGLNLGLPKARLGKARIDRVSLRSHAAPILLANSMINAIND